MKDVQTQTPTWLLNIDQVGVINVRYPISIRTKNSHIIHSVADLTMSVSLSKDTKGTHMSRFLEILNKYYSNIRPDSIDEILEDISTKLQADDVYLKIEFTYFMNKISPVSKNNSIMSFKCTFEGWRNIDTLMTVEVPICSLCPCSKEISDRGAHNQRGWITTTISIKDKFMWLEDLIELTQGCGSCEVWSLLKREDEKYVTETAFDNPMFVEDIVRQTANELEKNNIDKYVIKVKNHESIHDHDAFAIIKKGDFYGTRGNSKY